MSIHSNRKTYTVAVNITEKTEKGEITRQIPNFLLDSNSLGILNIGHAHKIVRDIVNPLNLPNLEIHVCALPL